MTERKTNLSSEIVAISIAEIKENRFIRYYNVFITITVALLLLSLIGIFLFKGNDYFLHIILYSSSSIIFLLFFRSIHVEAIESLKGLKEEIKNLDKEKVLRKLEISNISVIVNKKMIEKLININDFPIIEGEEDLYYVSTSKEENKELLKYLENNQDLLNSFGITKVTNDNIAVVYKIDSTSKKVLSTI